VPDSQQTKAFSATRDALHSMKPHDGTRKNNHSRYNEADQNTINLVFKDLGLKQPYLNGDSLEIVVERQLGSSYCATTADLRKRGMTTEVEYHTKSGTTLSIPKRLFPLTVLAIGYGKEPEYRARAWHL
jgi:hypothetical protein